MLGLHDRRLLLDALRPPVGYALDFAVGTTYSLDLLALLTAPLAFTLFDWQDAEGRPAADPLATLEAASSRYADRMAVFCQAGQALVPKQHLASCSATSKDPKCSRSWPPRGRHRAFTRNSGSLRFFTATGRPCPLPFAVPQPESYLRPLVGHCTRA